jgi:predicted TIM-barrel fold metal-dependent hydrolase
MQWNREPGLKALLDMCAAFPDTVVVVDHFSNLAADRGAPDFGVDSLLEQLARFPRVLQKFTMINIDKAADLERPFAPVVRRMVQSYGADRVMWGSDVAQSKGAYAELVRLGREATALLPEAESRQVLHGTAHSTYAQRRGPP